MSRIVDYRPSGGEIETKKVHLSYTSGTPVAGVSFSNTNNPAIEITEGITLIKHKLANGEAFVHILGKVKFASSQNVTHIDFASEDYTSFIEGQIGDFNISTDVGLQIRASSSANGISLAIGNYTFLEAGYFHATAIGFW